MEDRKSVSGSALCAQANSLAECYALTLCNMWVGTRQPYMRSLRGSRVLTQLEQQILRQKKSAVVVCFLRVPLRAAANITRPQGAIYF